MPASLKATHSSGQFAQLNSINPIVMLPLSLSFMVAHGRTKHTSTPFLSVQISSMMFVCGSARAKGTTLAGMYAQKDRLKVL